MTRVDFLPFLTSVVSCARPLQELLVSPRQRTGTTSAFAVIFGITVPNFATAGFGAGVGVGVGAGSGIVLDDSVNVRETELLEDGRPSRPLTLSPSAPQPLPAAGSG